MRALFHSSTILLILILFSSFFLFYMESMIDFVKTMSFHIKKDARYSDASFSANNLESIWHTIIVCNESIVPVRKLNHVIPFLYCKMLDCKLNRHLNNPVGSIRRAVKMTQEVFVSQSQDFSFLFLLFYDFLRFVLQNTGFCDYNKIAHFIFSPFLLFSFYIESMIDFSNRMIVSIVQMGAKKRKRASPLSFSFSSYVDKLFIETHRLNIIVF
ncbi:MAG: hypothetical protein DBX97_03425 [Collinsella tanakaei]|nr:MAG: hypothetical protein DBX97_03425 [Collinsella tanakaei]